MKIEKNYVVSGIIFYANKVLLIKHKKFNKWLYPGGHIEKNETPEEALKREIFEEVGLKVSIIDSSNYKYLAHANVRTLKTPFTIVEEVLIKTQKKEVYNIDLIYVCKSDKTEPLIINEKEVSEVHWFSINEIDNLDSFPELVPLINEAYDIYIKNIKIT